MLRLIERFLVVWADPRLRASMQRAVSGTTRLRLSGPILATRSRKAGPKFSPAERPKRRVASVESPP